MAVVKVYEYGNKFDFSKIKVGDTVVITSTNYGFGNSRDMSPKISSFQLNKVTAVGKDFIEVGTRYKFKQAIKYTNYFPLVNGNSEKEIEYTDEYLKITKCPDYIAPIENKVYDTEYYSYRIYEPSNGVTSPRYLFPYTEEWEKKIKECEERTSILKKQEEQKKIKEQQLIEMKKDSKAQYDAVINPLLRQLKELEEKIYNERCNSFDKFFCDKCKNNGGICKYEKEYGYFYYSTINPKTHRDGKGDRYRPIEDCQYFEKKEGK